ncbi:MAG: 50S ribosomal protein L4 [Deltaproteobacteria bacterium]|nr:MAG: 50S ribosomal protein L4 [Deltaproteobacteria bacterium]
MATFDVFNQNHDKVSSIELSDTVFDTEVKEHLFWEVVRNQLASRRAGTAKAKTRTEVRGGGRKPFRQKGTGRARQGSTRSPVMVGGGVAHGPKLRDYSYTVPKKVRQAALRSALSLRAQNNQLFILDNLELAEIKTKNLKAIFERFDLSEALVIDVDNNANLLLSCRNLPTFQVLPPAGLNVYDLLRYDNLILTEEAAKLVDERLNKAVRPDRFDAAEEATVEASEETASE